MTVSTSLARLWLVLAWSVLACAPAQHAWTKRKGTSKDDAMKAYVALVARLGRG